MSNQGPPGGVPAPSQPGQPAPSALPATGAAPAAPGSVVPGGVPNQVMTAHQEAFFHQIRYNQLLASGQLTPEVLQRNPRLQMIHAMMQQQMLAAGRAGAAAAGGKNIVTLPTSGGAASIFPQQNSLAAAAPASGAPSVPPPSRKRKVSAHKLPDRSWDYFPESSLFVSLQDAERRIDAALNRKMAALTELAASTKRVVEGRAVGDTPGSARKRLRIYIYSKHFNQPSENKPPPTDPHAPREPPSWSLNISGRLLDPDACHPGGGGDPEPPDDAHTSRHRFTYYLKRLEVRLDDENGPLPAARSVVDGAMVNTGVGVGDGTVVWEKAKMDHEARNSFEIMRTGDTPVRATITFEFDHQPALFVVPPALETLLSLQTGENGAPGLYSKTYLASKIWSYGRAQGMVTNTIDGPTFRASQTLLQALQVPQDKIDEWIIRDERLNAEEIQEVIKGALSPPQPLVLQHLISLDGPPTSPITCLDLHLEVPLEFQGTKESASVGSAAVALEKDLEQLDSQLGICWHRYKEHKRRHTVLSAFSVDPVGSVRQIIAAQGRELRVVQTKEGEAVEVMKLADLYGDKWTQDAILKYLAKKSAGPAAVPQLLAATQQLSAEQVQAHMQQYSMQVARMQQFAMQQQQMAVLQQNPGQMQQIVHQPQAAPPAAAVVAPAPAPAPAAPPPAGPAAVLQPPQ